MEASGSSRGDRRVAYGTVCADGGDVAPQRCSQVTGFISGLSHTAKVEAPAEINAVQDLGDGREQGRES